jgi:hypothetical protein
MKPTVEQLTKFKAHENAMNRSSFGYNQQYYQSHCQHCCHCCSSNPVYPYRNARESLNFNNSYQTQGKKPYLTNT